MIFTVVNYLPLIEELAHKKTELAKKDRDASGSGENGGDEDPEDDSEKLFCGDDCDPYANSVLGSIFWRRITDPYSSVHGDRVIPPPRF